MKDSRAEDRGLVAALIAEGGRDIGIGTPAGGVFLARTLHRMPQEVWDEIVLRHATEAVRVGPADGWTDRAVAEALDRFGGRPIKHRPVDTEFEERKA